MPSRCSQSCIDPYLALYRDCKPTLQAVQNVEMRLFGGCDGSSLAVAGRSDKTTVALADELNDMCLRAQNAGGGH